MKIKRASRYVPDWVQVNDDPKTLWRSRFVYLRDGAIAGLVLGIAAGLYCDWPVDTFTPAYNKWSEQQRKVSDQIGTGPARPTIRPQQVLPAPVVTAPQPQTQATTGREAPNDMPKWDVGFSAAQRTLTFRLLCMPARTQCADTQEEPAYVTFEGPASARLTATVPMHPTADAQSYSASLFVVGADQFSAPNRVVLPVGEWRMTVTFPRFNKQSEKKFWASCPKGQACSVVDYPIPLIER